MGENCLIERKKMKYTTVKNLRWTSDKKESIECIVDFDGLGELPFHAHPDDSESHGREIFERCAAGEFGEIEEFTPIQLDSIPSNDARLPPVPDNSLPE